MVVVTDLESQELEKEPDTVDPAASHLTQLEPHERQHFMVQLVECLWTLLAARPANPTLAPVCLPGEYCELAVASI